MSYGAYARLVPKSAYVVVVRAESPGDTLTIEARRQERVN